MLSDYRVNLKKLVAIAVPIMLSNLIYQAQMIIDKIFLGNVNSLYLSALGNATTIIWVLISFCSSITTGASILISQSYGARDSEKMNRFSGSLFLFGNIPCIISFLVMFFFSPLIYRKMGVSDNLLPMCVDYTRYYSPVYLISGIYFSILVVLQTSEQTSPLVYCGIIRASINIFLDWVLIYGKFGLPAMGIKGAALGTTIAEYIGTVIFIVDYKLRRNLATRPPISAVLSGKFRDYLFSTKLGLRVALEDLTWNFGSIVLTIIMNSISEKAAGIYSIVWGIQLIAVVITTAFGNATLTLSGEAAGRRDMPDLRNICITAYGICFAVSAATVLVCLLFPQQLVSIFTADPEVINNSALYMLLMSLGMFFRSGNIVIGNGIRATGDTTWMLLTQIFGTLWVSAVAVLLVYVFHIGLTGIFLAVLLDEFVRSLINLAKLRSIIRSVPAISERADNTEAEIRIML